MNMKKYELSTRMQELSRMLEMCHKEIKEWEKFKKTILKKMNGISKKNKSKERGMETNL